MTGVHRDTSDALIELRDALRVFASERDWEQFHTPKNLVMALSGEVGELIEHFQWLSPQASAKLDPATHREVGYEMADVLLYLIRLSDTLDIDLAQVAREKMELNARKYPADKARGTSLKYDRLDD